MIRKNIVEDVAFRLRGFNLTTAEADAIKQLVDERTRQSPMTPAEMAAKLELAVAPYGKSTVEHANLFFNVHEVIRALKEQQ